MARRFGIHLDTDGKNSQARGEGEAMLKAALKSVPLIGPLIRKVRGPKLIESSADYWESRYASGGTSGAGSYNRLASFKAEFINAYVSKHAITRVLEFGSGDCAQLALARYPEYVGVDVSPTIVAKARDRYRQDESVSFLQTSEVGQNLRADLTLSLDVIYHLVEDEVFVSYMRQLFGASDRAVIVYSSNKDQIWAPHVRHRRFTDWIETNCPDFKLVQHVPNRFPFNEQDPEHTSFADFYVFEKAAAQR
jgi:SAM-dependent methyltransferase